MKQKHNNHEKTVVKEDLPLSSRRNLDIAIQKIKEGDLECPEFDNTSTIGGVTEPIATTLEMAYFVGYEQCLLDCGELLAKAESDDEK